MRYLPLLNGRSDSSRRAPFHAPSEYVVAAQDTSQDYDQDRAIEAPVAQRTVAPYELTRSRFRIEYAVYAVLVVRIVLAPIQHTFPMIIRNGIGDARDNREDNDQWIKYGQILFCPVLLHLGDLGLFIKFYIIHTIFVLIIHNTVF